MIGGRSRRRSCVRPDEVRSARRRPTSEVRTPLSVVHLEQYRVNEARLGVRSPEVPIRVVYCIDNMQVGGTELNAVRTAERLDRRRFSISVVCIRESGPLMARYKDAGIPVHTFPMTSLLGFRAVQQAVRLVRLFRSERTDIVHSHDAYTSVYATMCARLAGVPGVIASRRSWHSPHLQGRIMRANRVAYRFADRVVGNSPSVSRLVESEGGVPASRIVTIPNFLDAEAFEPVSAAERRRLLDELGVPEGAFVVGIVARLSVVKDHRTLLHAVASLRPSILGLHCVLVGDGPERERIEGLAASLDITDIVHLAGERGQSPNLHALFDVSVLCSTTEAFPNSVLEAMAAARPVVATAVGGTPDAVREGSTGLLVPPRDPSRLADAILRLYREPALRARLGAAGCAVARADYSADAVISQVEALYTDLAGRSVA
jgi:glycosyltransferase involved in cell wall biosynthesis